MPSGPRWLLLAIVLVLSVTLRIVSLESDPPDAVSGALSPNEGLYVVNARNKVVDGDWKLDDWNSSVLYPIGSALAATMFEVSGTGIRQARWVSVLLSSLGLLLFFLLIREASGFWTALLATLFFGTNPVYLAYSRLAGPPPISILLMLLTIVLWRLSAGWPVLAPVAGALLALTAVIENGSHTMFFLSTALLATLMVRLQAWKMPWAPAVRTRIRIFWWSLIITLLAWLAVFVLPNSEEFIRMLDTPLSSVRWGNAAQNLFMAPFDFAPLIQWMPLVFMISLLYLLIYARSLMAAIARHRPLSETRVWFFAWLVTGPAFMAMRSERTLNVLVFMVPPLCMAAAEALTRLLSVRQFRKPKLDILVVLGLLSLVTWIVVQTVVHAVVLLGYQWIPEWFYRHQFRWEFAIVLALAAPIALLLSSLWLNWKKFTLDISPGGVSALFAATLIAVLFMNAFGARSILRPSYRIRGAAASLTQLPQGSVIAGTWAPLLSLDSRHRSLILWRNMNSEPGVLERLRVTHLLLQHGSGEALEQNPAFIERLYGFARPVPMETFMIEGAELNLYRLEPTGR